MFAFKFFFSTVTKTFRTKEFHKHQHTGKYDARQTNIIKILYKLPLDWSEKKECTS